MNDYDKLDEIGKEKFKQFYNKYLSSIFDTLYFFKDPYSPIDAIIYSKKEKIFVLIEIKNRNDYYISFKDSFLELKKKNAIFDKKEYFSNKLPKDIKIKTIYFNSYTISNETRVVYLDKIDFNKEKVYSNYCNKTTASYNGKKDKECYHITSYQRYFL